MKLNLKKNSVAKARKLARRTKFHGMDISIETDKGQYRYWHDAHGKETGKTLMRYPYGYVRRTIGADDEHIDCYLGPNKESKKVFIVHQMKKPDFDKYDEDKVMFGFDSPKEAKQAYLGQYNDPKFFGSMDEMTIEEFKDEFVKKALPNQQPPSDQSNDPMMQIDPFDIDNIQAVQGMIRQVMGMKDKDLLKISERVWGPGYQYQITDINYVKYELLGYLKDRYDLLEVMPPMLPVDDLPDPMQLDHANYQTLEPESAEAMQEQDPDPV